MHNTHIPPFSKWWPVLGRTCIQHGLGGCEGEEVFPWLLAWLEKRGFVYSRKGKRVSRAWGEERGIRFFFRLRFILVLKRNKLRIVMWGAPQAKGLPLFALWHWFLPFIFFGLFLHFHVHLNSLQDALEEDLRLLLAQKRPYPQVHGQPLPLSHRTFFDRHGKRHPKE